MNRTTSSILLVLSLIFLLEGSFAQVAIDPCDPPNNKNIPGFFKSGLEAIGEEIRNLEKGTVEIIATSPGGLPVYAVFYGEKEDFHSQANYNSAVAARNPSFFADRDSSFKPVVFFLGPVHGQEVEGIAGVINLIHIAETGKDYRGKEWSTLKSKMDKCRIIIIPCGNPDGRKRCPYDSFIGLPTSIMTKYGQGTHKDGSSWGWPQAKSLHPMTGDVGILGAYFNDNGINMMHDDFFSPMADETKAILDLARSEAPDITVSLHSHEYPPRIIPTYYIPWFMKEEIDELTRQVNKRLINSGLVSYPDSKIAGPGIEDEEFPPQTSFNLASALHHVSGTMAFVFENCHGSLNEGMMESPITYDDIIDIQMLLFEEMIDYVIKSRF